MQWKDNGSGIDFDPAPAGTHPARCYQIIDLGTHHNEMYNNDRHQVFVGFELPTELNRFKDADGNEQEKPFVIGKFYTMSLNEKATLRGDLESWRGKAFSEQELNGFNPKVLIGIPCMLSVIHKDKNGKTRADISAVSKLPKQMTCPDAVHDPVYFSLDEYSDAAFEKVPKGFQNMIRNCQEWGSLGNPSNEQDTPPDNGDFKDDDIPF